jgi:hypothetical protein
LVRSGPLREGRGDDGQRGGGDQRGAEALQAPRGDQHPGRRGEAVEQRGQREQGDAGHEQPAAADEVRRPPAEQQEAAEHERVAVDDPREVGGGEAEVALDRGQGDVHDRRVEHDHELREADEDEHEPAVGRRAFLRDGVSGHAVALYGLTTPI